MSATATPARPAVPSRRPAGDTFRRFQPTLTLGYHQDLHALAKELSVLELEPQRALLREAIERVATRRIELIGLGVPPSELQPTVAYVAALYLLRDLLTQGWVLSLDDEGVLLRPPATTVSASDDPAGTKELLRQSFAFARQAQLAEQGTSTFVRAMERRGVEALFADGPEVAERLSRALRERGSVAEAIRPALELVTPDARDEATGLRLQEVWRYARHFWSIPYQSTPGRNLFYLVRDEAHPKRAVMGIAALGNPILGLAQRDDYLGWSVPSLRRQLVAGDARRRRRIAQHLVEVLQRDIANIYVADLEIPERPNAGTVARLREIEKAASDARRRRLSDAGHERTEDYRFIRAAHDQVRDGGGDDVDWVAVARTDLYRRKRASTLADLLQASFALADVLADGPDALLAALETARGRSAVEVALRRIKQQSVAENIMEIITCGAVPPYGDLLGGKLVAMLLTSPKVAADVRARYRDRVSLIASGLKGEAVRRDPNLCVLTTSSLYAVGSSQYNRIRIPGDIVDSTGQVSYVRVGTTDSFGTVHIAPDTAAVLVALARLSDDNRRLVNHLFGEGVSPKLRALRSGLQALGLAPDVFLRHHAPRLLYAAALAENADDVLLGIARRPRYVIRGRTAGDGVRAIADFWRTRWLEPRLHRSDVLNRLRSVEKSSFLLGAEIPPATSAVTASGPHSWLAVGADPHVPRHRSQSGGPSEFVERLYRSTNSYADRLSSEQLAWVDVDLGLNDHLLELARAGKQIVVSGNPGDGKTHLIERLRSRLEDECGALVLTDANMHSDEELLVAWRTCDRDGRPMVLAINEWPLFVLRRHADAVGFGPLAEALRQVQHATFFVHAPPAPANDIVRVIDLSLRNVLAAPVVLAVVDRLTHERFYEGLPAHDPARVNRAALQHPRVRERLVKLLERVARQGHHATMRQLVGFIAYLLTGGRTPVERLGQPGSHRFHYSTLCFDEDAVGPFFDAVRAGFDPAAVTHPRHDADLWRGTTSDTGWIEPASATVGAVHLPPPDADRQATYLALKRRFYFEHEQGGDLLELVPSDEQAFDRLAREGQAGVPTVVRDLLVALNRFFEPDFPETERDQLYLWQSHRFDVRSPETFMALHNLGHQAFRIQPPQFAPWVDWLPAGQRLLRSFALVAQTEHEATVSLTVDRPLYLTLIEAQRGLARASWSRSATRKITRFVDRLHQLTDQAAEVEDVRIRNTETDMEQKFEIQRTPARYLL